MRYLVDPSEFKSPAEVRNYLKAQESMLLEVLYGNNNALKSDEVKHFVPALARYWKMHLNTPGVSSFDQRIATIHCAELVRFGKSHKYSEDYKKMIQDPQHTTANNLEASLERENSTVEDMVLVRDLRIT